MKAIYVLPFLLVLAACDPVDQGTCLRGHEVTLPGHPEPGKPNLPQTAFVCDEFAR
jgi:hypothetical protein